MAKQPGSDWGSISSFGGKVSSVFKGAGSGGARVRKNTNAVAGVVKPIGTTASMKTKIIQNNSVKKDYQTYSTKDINSLVNDVKKTVKPSSPKKVVAKRATLSSAQQRAIEEARKKALDWR
jgi:hypothetical protein